jgi:hypothetical protein
MGGKRCVVMLAALLSNTVLFAADPPARSSRAKQREVIEAILARPVEWSPRDTQSVTIDEFIGHVREKHGLAIRWDAGSLQMLGGDSGSLFGSVRNAASRANVVVWGSAPPSPYVKEYSTVVPASLQQHVTNFPPSDPVQAAPAPATPPAGVPQPAPLPAGPPAEPLPGSAVLPKAAPVSEAMKSGNPSEAAGIDESELPHLVLSARPIHLSTVALANATVGDALRQLLDAALPSMSSMGEDIGLPFITRAMTLDYVIEGSAVVITTKLRANAIKETRVYRVGHLKAMPPESVAKAICHAVRPWSWRSQTTEIADRLAARWPKGGLPIPQVSIGSVYSAEAVVQTANQSPLIPAGAQPTSTASPELSPAAVEGIGQLLTGGASGDCGATGRTGSDGDALIEVRSPAFLERPGFSGSAFVAEEFDVQPAAEFPAAGGGGFSQPSAFFRVRFAIDGLGHQVDFPCVHMRKLVEIRCDVIDVFGVVDDEFQLVVVIGGQPTDHIGAMAAGVVAGGPAGVGSRRGVCPLGADRHQIGGDIKVDGSRGFDGDVQARMFEPLRQVDDVFDEHRFAAGDDDVLALKGLHFIDKRIDAAIVAFWIP